MTALPPAELSLTTLAALAEVGPAGPGRAVPPVTLAGSGNVFSASCATKENLALSPTDHDTVTPARPLPSRDGLTAEWEERAAILEYEGGWPRTLAEEIATRLMYLSQRDSTVEERRALDTELLDLERRRQAAPRDREPSPPGPRRVPPRRLDRTGV